MHVYVLNSLACSRPMANIDNEVQGVINNFDGRIYDT